MDVHLCVYAPANVHYAESGADKSGSMYFGPNRKRWQHRDVDDQLDEWRKHIDLYGPVSKQFSEPDSRHQFCCDSGCGQEKDGNRASWPGFWNPSFDYSAVSDRTGGYKSPANGFFQCVVAQH
jgi:hypothetical protein